MNPPLLRSYNAVIKHTLSQAKNPEQRNTLPVFVSYRAHGQWKTSALYRSGFADNVPPALETIKKSDSQAILVTHRWNILHDIYEKQVRMKTVMENHLTLVCFMRRMNKLFLQSRLRHYLMRKIFPQIHS